jgi:hypothetical protein
MIVETMPRHSRVHAEGLLYHVMARGNDGQKIFVGESDYQAFIEALRGDQKGSRPPLFHPNPDPWVGTFLKCSQHFFEER